MVEEGKLGRKVEIGFCRYGPEGKRIPGSIEMKLRGKLWGVRLAVRQSVNFNKVRFPKLFFPNTRQLNYLRAPPLLYPI
jgi:hypothetical protein